MCGWCVCVCFIPSDPPFRTDIRTAVQRNLVRMISLTAHEDNQKEVLQLIDWKVRTSEDMLLLTICNYDSKPKSRPDKGYVSACWLRCLF